MSKAVATKEEAGLPAYADEMFDDGVLGYSEAADDSLIPILSILQDNSGEVKKRHERHIEDAEAGMLIIRSVQKVFNGDEGITFQPCGFSHTWVEWEGEPGEGRPVGQFDFSDKPSDAVEVDKPDGGSEWRRDNGNRIVETRNHFGNVLMTDGGLMPMVIAMSGSNHTASRQWTTLMKQHRTPSGKRAAAFMRTYKITTVFSQKGQQTWYKYKIQDLGWVEEEGVLMDGYNFAKSIAANDVKADVASDTGGSGNDGETPF